MPESSVGKQPHIVAHPNQTWVGCRHPDQRGIRQAQIDGVKRRVDDESTDQENAGQEQELKLPGTAFSRGRHWLASLQHPLLSRVSKDRRRPRSNRLRYTISKNYFTAS